MVGESSRAERIAGWRAILGHDIPYDSLQCFWCNSLQCCSPRSMLSTLKRTQLVRRRFITDTGLTLRVIRGSSNRAPTNDPFGTEGKRILTPVKDISSNLPDSEDVEVFNRQEVSCETRSIRRRSQLKDLHGAVRANSSDRRLLAIPGWN